MGNGKSDAPLDMETREGEEVKWLEWAETNARENLKARLAAVDFLATQAHSLLQLLLVGMGGALAYGVKVFEPGKPGPLIIGSAALCVWLAWICFLLVFKCISTKSQPSVYNKAAHLYLGPVSTGEKFKDIRTAELRNLDNRIEAAKELNRDTAWWLDRCRYAAVGSPIVFALSALAGS